MGWELDVEDLVELSNYFFQVDYLIYVAGGDCSETILTLAMDMETM